MIFVGDRWPHPDIGLWRWDEATICHLSRGLDGPELLHRLGDADVIVDHVEESAQGGHGQQDECQVGQLRHHIAHNGGTHVVRDHGLDAPARAMQFKEAIGMEGYFQVLAAERNSPV